jgi:GNAT superfamily N-acetyltransferase
MIHRPAVVRDQDSIEIRLTAEDEYRIPFTFIEALNEGTLADRPADVFRAAARENRLFQVLNKATDNIIGTGVIQPASAKNKDRQQAEVGGLIFHPAARGFGIASLLVKVMMVHALKESGRDLPEEEYLAHVLDGNGGPIHALLDAGFKPIGHVELHRGDIDAVIDHMVNNGDSAIRVQGFAFDRRAIDNLMFALWKFIRREHGLIVRSGPAGDIRLTVDFAHVISPEHLDREVEMLTQRDGDLVRVEETSQ